MERLEGERLEGERLEGRSPDDPVINQFKVDEEMIILDYLEANRIGDYPIWLGSRVPARNKKWLDYHRISHILDVGSPNLMLFPDIHYKKIFIDDDVNAPIFLYFNECINFINEAITRGTGILVHCFAGISRSATIILAWMIRMYFQDRRIIQSSDFDYICLSDLSCGVDNFVSHLRKFRGIIQPNDGFMAQLETFFQNEQANTLFFQNK
jgi:protein tyrosine phosphatase